MKHNHNTAYISKLIFSTRKMTPVSVTEHLGDIPDTVLNGLHTPNFIPENSPLQSKFSLFVLYGGEIQVNKVAQVSQKDSQQVSVGAWV